MGFETKFYSRETVPVKKRIIICCDGTWQSSTDLDPNHAVPSNVTRLFRVVAQAGTDRQDNHWQQVTYYGAGVGTGSITRTSQYLQGAFGYGVIEDIIEAYNFIVNNYSPGDEIFLFGFSRGAYTVRAVAELICEIGMLSRSSMSKFTEIYHIFSKKNPNTSLKRFGPWREYLAKNPQVIISEDVTIQAIGVWDTVTGPLAQRQFNLTLDPKIKHAFQALALDEKRKHFSPEIWRLPRSENSTRLCQVWFPGVHINVGGGATDNINEIPREDREQFADITFAWMLDMIQPYLALTWDSVEEELGANAGLGQIPYTSDNLFSYATGIIYNSYSLFYRLFGGGSRIRTPGAYHNHNDEYTVERIHPSVYFRQLSDERLGRPIYEPMALKRWERTKVTAGPGRKRSGWKWQKIGSHDGDGLWEFQIGRMETGRSVERLLIERFDWPREILQELDREYKEWEQSGCRIQY